MALLLKQDQSWNMQDIEWKTYGFKGQYNYCPSICSDDQYGAHNSHTFSSDKHEAALYSHKSYNI